MSSSTIGTSPRARHHPVQKAALQTGSAAFSLCTGISIRPGIATSTGACSAHSVCRSALSALRRPSAAEAFPAPVERSAKSSSDHGSTDLFMPVEQCTHCSHPIGGYRRSIGDSSIMATQSSLTIPRFTYSSAIVSRGWESIARWQISLPSRSRRPRRLPVQPSRGLRHRQLRSGS